MRGLLAAVAAIAMLPSNANAAQFVNGSFEAGTPAGSFTTVSGEDNSSVTGWVATGNSVDYIGNYWGAQDGSRSIDLNGSAQGGIKQTFDTLSGVQYNVTFWLAGNPDGSPATKSVLVAATGAADGLFSFDSTGASKSNMGWSKYTYNFLATGTSTTLSFASQNAGAYGAALDNVAVAAVPEPATWALMLIGFAAVGFGMRRRSPTAVSARYA